MSYAPTEWTCGDTITAEKLNKLEQGLADCCGGGGEPLIVRFDHHDSAEDRYYYDKTWQEIHDAMLVSPVVLIHRDGVTTSNIKYVEADTDIDSYVAIFSMNYDYTLHAESANGYVYEPGGAD